MVDCGRFGTYSRALRLADAPLHTGRGFSLYRGSVPDQTAWHHSLESMIDLTNIPKYRSTVNRSRTAS
ncbi:uncharacterized protein MELLADRAFT_95374 [Melampsora larici-populina 98AG31]|uniref:Uncharacterized protein n=1 Tax=Melampsora larici-populina (strain 98AG31 / pathotype 3-4-7) TaxID=747676 RepID=F4RCA9_MELLP|nr:uncharacterized protein MELLADRAFT_95374 [Melampsora larici-populina 98AG31]EGG09865.1 hypothetical protein MELLADRAFT_95374 [Melampsora larici-populina 98AG31]